MHPINNVAVVVGATASGYALGALVGMSATDGEPRLKTDTIIASTAMPLVFCSMAAYMCATGTSGPGPLALMAGASLGAGFAGGLVLGGKRQEH